MSADLGVKTESLLPDKSTVDEDIKVKTVKHELEMLLSLKKITSKVHEFNLKFRSR